MARRTDPDSVVFDFGRKVAELRSKQGWTQEQFAEKAGFSLKYAQRIEAGRANLSIRSLAKLANVLLVDVQELLRRPKNRRVVAGRPTTRSSKTKR